MLVGTSKFAANRGRTVIVVNIFQHMGIGETSKHSHAISMFGCLAR